MGGIKGLNSSQSVLFELSNKVRNFFKVRIRTDRMGKHRQPPCLFNLADHFARLGLGMFNKSRAAALKITRESIPGIFCQALLRQQTGKVRTTYLVSSNLGQIITGYGNTEGLQTLQDPLVALMPGLLQPCQKGKEPGVLMAEAISQNMKRNPRKAGAYLYSRKKFNPDDSAVGKSLWNTCDGVVIGEGNGRKSPTGGKRE